MYGVEGGFPLFFDVDGRGSEIYPTGLFLLHSSIASFASYSEIYRHWFLFSSVFVWNFVGFHGMLSMNVVL